MAARHLARGRQHLKLYLWRSAPIAVRDLSLTEPLVEWLTLQGQAGRPIHLATGAPRPLAEALAARLPFFGETFATTAECNLTGPRKAALLVERFGEGGFDYVGNSATDLDVWAHARVAIACNAPVALVERLRAGGARLGPVFDRQGMVSP